MHSAALNSSGFAFVIDPDAFVVHRPHTKSTAQRIFDDENDRRWTKWVTERAACYELQCFVSVEAIDVTKR